MTAALLGSKEKCSGGQICGNMTSGGTESILMAVKSSRDYMKARKGITRPEMCVTFFPVSLLYHFSYWVSFFFFFCSVLLLGCFFLAQFSYWVSCSF